MSQVAETRPKEVDGVDVQEAYDFLDSLRESGVTNMFGAPAYVREEFGCSKATARQLFVWWTEDFSA